MPPVTASAQQLLPYRWAFIFGYECNRDDVGKIKSLIDVSAEHGLNGIVLSSFGLDGITRWDAKQIAFFSAQGFRTFGAAYYDADDLVGCAEWLKSLGNTPKAQGILYTTRERK